MPTDRTVIAKRVDAYATALLDGAFGKTLDDAAQDESAVASNDANTVISADTEAALLEIRANLLHMIESVRNPDLVIADEIEHTPFTPEQRHELALTMTEDCNPIFQDVFAVLFERDELDLLLRIRTAFEDKLEATLNVVIVDVASVVELDDHLRDLIKKKAESELDRQVILCEYLDENLLGGVTMRARGRLLDASIATGLENMRYNLKKKDDGGEQ